MTMVRAVAKVAGMSDRPKHLPRSGDAAQRLYGVAGQTLAAPKLAAGLHIVATPIGNLGDITLRALEALAGADVIACEDTRVTRKLLDRYAIATPLTPYHDHNAAKARPVLISSSPVNDGSLSGQWTSDRCRRIDPTAYCSAN